VCVCVCVCVCVHKCAYFCKRLCGWVREFEGRENRSSAHPLLQLGKIGLVLEGMYSGAHSDGQRGHGSYSVGWRTGCRCGYSEAFGCWLGSCVGCLLPLLDPGDSLRRQLAFFERVYHTFGVCKSVPSDLNFLVAVRAWKDHDLAA
jgi:hypothetical protein